MHTILTEQPVIDEILNTYKKELGVNFNNYRNHVYRVFNFAVYLDSAGSEAQKQLAVAAAFHDIGIWTNNTFDYLEPSISLSNKYLQANNLAHWADTVSGAIDNHHKLSSYKSSSTVENFRKADLIDLSFGVISFGLARTFVDEAYKKFPSAGFHSFIALKILKNIFTHPFNPLPVLKF